ncbi:NADH:flavin oxidoreductase [Priestia megaterium]|uniref:NADH:flavin oxidoreductase n=1 Tax=Priestia megaterium TaxID=1404 RepID=UPI00298C7C0E|nr:NADH:flavin oxidoreductase [Priestia megaterium]
MSNIKSLFEPFNLGTATLKNRVGVAPMTRISATEKGFVTDKMINYYRSFAEGGFGLIITEGTYIDDKYSQTYDYQPGIVFEEQVESWNKLINSVHAEGAKVIMQLQHSGALSQGNRFVQGTIAPSSVQPKGEQLTFYSGKGPYVTPREITKEEIAGVIQSFVASAKRAKSAGAEGIEIHGANGYLLDEFLTDYTNQRTDEYGGSVENRVRLLEEIVQAIRAAVGKEFIVGIRISQAKVNDPTHKWAGKEKEAEIIFTKLGQTELDYIHVTEYKAWEPAFDSSDATFAALAKKYSKLPIIANGHLEDTEKAIKLLESGDADIVTLGKGALANHDWVQKVQNGEHLREFNAEEILSPSAVIKDFEL